MPLSLAISDFCLAIGGKSPRTIKTYRHALGLFARYAHDAEPATLSLDTLVGFAKSTSDQAVASRKLYLVAVRRFYKYLIGERLLMLDAADVVRLDQVVRDLLPKQDRLPHIVAPRLIERVAQEASRAEPSSEHATAQDRTRAELRRLRNVAIVHCLRSSGMRIGELVALKRGDVANLSARVIGKGNKERVIYFDDVAWDALKAYWQVRGTLTPNEPAFARHDRGTGKVAHPLSDWRIEQLFRAWVERAGIEEHLTPHSLRHAFATRVLEATEDLAVVQDMLGHASPATTRIYARVSGKRMKQAHDKAFGK